MTACYICGKKIKDIDHMLGIYLETDAYTYVHDVCYEVEA